MLASIPPYLANCTKPWLEPGSPSNSERGTDDRRMHEPEDGECVFQPLQSSRRRFTFQTLLLLEKGKRFVFFSRMFGSDPTLPNALALHSAAFAAHAAAGTTCQLACIAVFQPSHRHQRGSMSFKHCALPPCLVCSEATAFRIGGVDAKLLGPLPPSSNCENEGLLSMLASLDDVMSLCMFNTRCCRDAHVHCL